MMYVREEQGRFYLTEGFREANSDLIAGWRRELDEMLSGNQTC
jgi:hypothetical protein